MNPSEQSVRHELEKDGWTVHRGGYPDFLCTKENELKFVEVKGFGDVLRSKQLLVINTLRKFGLKVDLKIAGLTEILAVIQNKPRLTPVLIAEASKLNPGVVRNVLMTLTELKLVISPARGIYEITELGEGVLKEAIKK